MQIFYSNCQEETERDFLEVDDYNDLDFKPPLLQRNEAREKLNESLVQHGHSPVKFNLSKKKFNDYSTKLQHYSVRKLSEHLQDEKQSAAAVIMPNDPEGLINAFNNEELNPDDYSITQAKSMYEQANSTDAKFGVLTIFCETFSIQKLVSTFGCTEYTVNQARQTARTLGILEKKEKLQQTRKSMNPDLIKHFLVDLVQNNILKTRPFGVNRLTFESGDMVVVPKALLIGGKRQTCLNYIKMCQEIETPHLSLSSLMKILNTVKPTQCVELSCLDNILVEGAEGFKTLENIAQQVSFIIFSILMFK